MQINAINANVNQKLNNKQAVKNNNVQYQTNLLADNKDQNVSFGGLGSALKNGSTKLFKFIDNSSFFVEFLIIDTLSMVLPRVAVGLNRDKEQLGHLNYKAGAEELGREALSGPSMNLLPMATLAAVSAVKPASKMETSTLKGLTENMKDVVANSSANTDMHKELAGKIFDNAFNGASKEDKNAFVELLGKVNSCKSRKEVKEASAKFVEKVAEINNKLATTSAPLNAKSVKLGNGEINAAHLFEDFGAYSKDVIAKISKADKSDAAQMLDKLAKNRGALKFGTALAAFFAVGGFLKQLPKLYQQKGLSPAQESALRASGQLPAQEDAKTGDKKVSFGGKLGDFAKLERGGTMSRGLFILNAFVFLLSSRILTSRDKDERRETIIRDIPTIVVSVKGVPMISNAVGSVLQKKNGFAINQNKSVASYSQIQDWHTIDGNLKSGLNGFAERMNSLGGNMKKVCSALGGEIKDQVKGFSDNNKEFMAELSKNESLAKKVTEALKNPNNGAAKQAAFSKTITKMTGFGATMVAIGMLLPKINIAITKAVHKNDGINKQA